MATKLQIVIDGSPLDLIEGEETRFFITRILQDVTDLSSRNSDRTNTIKVPLTDNNQSLLGIQVPDKGRFSDQPINRFDCQVLLGGLPVLPDAYFIVGQQDDDAITLTVFSGTSKFFANLSDDPINALNFSEYDLNWTLSEVASIVNESSGVVYADSIWYTNESRRLYEAQSGGSPPDSRTNLNDIELAESGFFIYTETILDKIFATIPNLTFDTSLTDLTYSRLALACPVPVLHDAFIGVDGLYSEVRNTLSNALSAGKLTFPTVITDTAGVWDNTNNEYDLTAGAFVVRCRFQGTIKGIDLIRFQLKDSGGTILKEVIFPGTSQTTPFDLAIIYTVNVTTTESLYVDVVLEGVGGSATSSLDFASFSVEQQGIGRGNRVVVADFLPNISQKDFVKEIFNLFNIIPTEKANVITLNYFDSIVKSSNSFKLDVSKQIKRTTSLFTYGQESIMKYTDNVAVERLDSDTSFPVNDLSIPRTKVVIESAFSATDDAEQNNVVVPRVVIPNYDLVYNFNGVNTMSTTIATKDFTTVSPHGVEPGDYINVNGDRRKVLVVTSSTAGQVDVDFSATVSGQTWDHWTYEKQGVEMHLAYMQTNQPDVLTIRDGGSSTTSNSHARAVWSSFLKWDELKADYYNIITRSVLRPYAVEAWTSLPVTTLLENTSKLEAIYIDDLKGWFYVNKFEQWKFDNTVRVQLLEIDI